MEKTILAPVEISVSFSDLLKSLRLKAPPEEEDEAVMRQMLEEAHGAMCPKGLFGIARVEARGEGHVVVEGVRLDSALLSKNLQQVHCIYPYVVTCGVELEAWSGAYQEDFMQEYWADAIKLLVLRKTLGVVQKRIEAMYAGGEKLSYMCPGPVEDWPLSQQKPFFEILGDVKGLLGVTLSESCLMLPSKSMSGFYFLPKERFSNCRHCTLRDCPNRSAPYGG